MFEVSVEVTFSAGHALRGYRGKCENVHGHNYKVSVTISGEELNPIGLLVDFAEVRAALRAAAERLDHRFLNDLPPFDRLNPSAENLAKYFSDALEPRLGKNGLRLGAVTVWETDTTAATYRPPSGA